MHVISEDDNVYEALNTMDILKNRLKKLIFVEEKERTKQYFNSKQRFKYISLFLKEKQEQGEDFRRLHA